MVPQATRQDRGINTCKPYYVVHITARKATSPLVGVTSTFTRLLRNSGLGRISARSCNLDLAHLVSVNQRWRYRYAMLTELHHLMTNPRPRGNECGMNLPDGPGFRR